MKRLHFLQGPVPARTVQSGLTLIELMVAMVIGLLIAIVASVALLTARQGFTAVDTTAQLRDNSRFIQDLVSRLAVQAGYKNVIYAATPVAAKTSGVTEIPAPNVFGLNNASRADTDDWNAGTTRTSTDPAYGSDILVLRYQTSTASAESTSSDGTMIDCSGAAPITVPANRDDRLVSILHIGTGAEGEPSLMCSRSESGGPPYTTETVVRGVENLQILYGVDGIGPGNTTVPIAASSADSVPDRYLRANQLTVSGNEAATHANWERVRSIRIGIVLRGPVGSAIDKTTQTFYPLGLAKGSASGTAGSLLASSSNDPGTIFNAPADGRLRYAVAFEVHLRNFQGDN